MKNVDCVIIGGGIIGLAIAKQIKAKYPNKSITILEKENSSIEHGSGRNSGVIHAGFYYPAHSLKAKFTAQGNAEMKGYCRARQLKLNECGKLVVAQSEEELAGLATLAERAKQNGVNAILVDEQQTKEIEPNAKTFEQALYSPDTSSADPAEVTNCLAQELISSGIDIHYGCGYQKLSNKNEILTTSGEYVSANYIINCAGLYADKIAKSFGFSKHYAIVPFKGIYLKYTLPEPPVKTNLYPVPNLKNPFLGVHYTVTVDNEVKIGPTAIPAFWRENYNGLDKFNLTELFEVLYYEAKLFTGNHFNFRDLAFEEFKKYNRSHFANQASKMVEHIDVAGFNKWTKPGIRAQLLNTKTMMLEQDFVIESDNNSLHVLNAVSPAWTSSFPFARYIVEHYLSMYWDNK